MLNELTSLKNVQAMKRNFSITSLRRERRHRPNVGCAWTPVTASVSLRVGIVPQELTDEDALKEPADWMESGPLPSVPCPVTCMPPRLLAVPLWRELAVLQKVNACSTAEQRTCDVIRSQARVQQALLLLVRHAPRMTHDTTGTLNVTSTMCNTQEAGKLDQPVFNRLLKHCEAVCSVRPGVASVAELGQPCHENSWCGRQ